VIRCEKSSEITAYLKGEIPEGEREPLRIHFEDCDRCRGELGRFDRVLGALGKLEPVEPSAGFKWRVREAFLRAHPEFLEAPRPRRIPGFWENLRTSFSYVPAWALSVTAHVVLLAVAAIIIFAPKDPEDAIEDLAVRAKPIPAPGPGPAFGGDPSGRDPGRPDPFVLPDPGLGDFVPPRGVRPGAGIRPPRRDADPGLELVDTGKWRERIPRDRRLLAFFEARGRDPQQADLRALYGAQGVEAALRNGLDWLARQQRPEGLWEGPVVRGEDGAESTYSTGLTGLALLAFLGEGHTPRSGAHAAVVRRGTDWLLTQQKATGLLGPERGNYLYNHAIAGLALLEAGMLTRDEGLQTASAMAVTFAVSAQNTDGGWGYVSRSPDSDTSVAAWMTHLLRLAKLGGNQGVIGALVRAQQSLRSRVDADGKVGYRSRLSFPNGYHALTAAGMFGLLMTTHTPDRELGERQSALLLERPSILGADPAQQPLNDLYFAYFGSLALHQAGGEVWTAWWGPLKAVLLRIQQPDGAWPAALDRWYAYGGPVYATAMGVLTLETPTRYPRLFE
jgi:hypothetical protein